MEHTIFKKAKEKKTEDQTLQLYKSWKLIHEAPAIYWHCW